MPRSVRGSFERGSLLRHARRKRLLHAAAGFTLLELLVAVTILAVAAVVVTLTVAPREGRDFDEEVRRLAALFRLAQDHARVTGTTLVWEADLSGYRFRQRDDAGGDSPLPEDELLRARRWPFVATGVVADPIVFGREPLLEPATIALSTASREIRLRLDPLGNLTEVR